MRPKMVPAIKAEIAQSRPPGNLDGLATLARLLAAPRELRAEPRTFRVYCRLFRVFTFFSLSLSLPASAAMGLGCLALILVPTRSTSLNWFVGVFLRCSWLAGEVGHFKKKRGGSFSGFGGVGQRRWS